MIFVLRFIVYLASVRCVFLLQCWKLVSLQWTRASLLPPASYVRNHKSGWKSVSNHLFLETKVLEVTLVKSSSSLTGLCLCLRLQSSAQSPTDPCLRRKITVAAAVRRPQSQFGWSSSGNAAEDSAARAFYGIHKVFHFVLDQVKSVISMGQRQTK